MKVHDGGGVLYLLVGRKPPDAAAVWKHAAADGRAAAAGWIKAGGWQAKSQTSRREKERCRKTRFNVLGFRVFRCLGRSILAVIHRTGPEVNNES